MDESCGRKTIFDVGVRPNVYHEWDVFEFHVHNFGQHFGDYAIRNAPYELDLGERLAFWAGDDKCLNAIRECFMQGVITNDVFEKALQSHKEAVDEMRSDQRDEAAADYLAALQQQK